ncbi:MAG: tail fiber domain-containing protein [Microbacterium sp.]
MADPTPAPGGELGELIRQLLDIKRRITDLESPSGTQRFQSVEKLQALVADIQAQLAIYNASRYTNAQIDARIAAPPSGVAATGDVSSTASLRGRNLYATDAPTFNITGTRVTAWLESATGRLGFASSSRRLKCAIEPAGIDVDDVLSIEPKTFRYKAEIRKRIQLRIDGIDPDYPVAHEFGFIAEDLDERGLGQFVIYDDEGEPVGIEYSMLVVAQQAVLRDLDARYRGQQTQIDALTARLDALDGGTHGAD